MTQRVPRIMKKRLKMAIAAAEMLYSTVEREGWGAVITSVGIGGDW